jgi:hypothetical protein
MVLAGICMNSAKIMELATVYKQCQRMELTAIYKPF